MREGDSDWWSGLQTVSSFDNGVTSPVTLDAGDEVQQFSPSSLLVESLIGQLCKLIEKNPSHQKQLYLKICKKLHQMKLIDDTYELEEFETMRSYYQKALYQMVYVAKCANKAVDKKTVATKPYREVCLKSDAILEWSRYSTEYDEMDFIARGGFGQVFRARHKLDGEIYAVKKIFLRYNNAARFLQSLAEVKMLARLNHPNIVTYKAAWLEPIDPTQRKQHLCHNVSSCIVEPSAEIQDSSDSIVFESSDRKEEDPDSDDNLAIITPVDTLTDWNHSSMSNNYSQIQERPKSICDKDDKGAIAVIEKMSNAQTRNDNGFKEAKQDQVSKKENTTPILSEIAATKDGHNIRSREGGYPGRRTPSRDNRGRLSRYRRSRGKRIQGKIGGRKPVLSVEENENDLVDDGKTTREQIRNDSGIEDILQCTVSCITIPSAIVGAKINQTTVSRGRRSWSEGFQERAARVRGAQGKGPQSRRNQGKRRQAEVRDVS